MHVKTQLQRESDNWYQCPCCYRGRSQPGTCDGVTATVDMEADPQPIIRQTQLEGNRQIAHACFQGTT